MAGKSYSTVANQVNNLTLATKSNDLPILNP